MAKRLVFPSWVMGLVFLFLSAGSVFGQATELFFSEYVEGTSSNRIIEVYNGTGATVDLSDYEVRLHANGTTGTTSSLSLSGSLADGKVVVIRNTAAASYTASGGNLRIDNNGVTAYNGDDAISLWNVSGTATMIDVIGRIGCDPGSAWTGTSSYSTVDKTLRRKSNVCGGITVNPTGTCNASSFPTLNSEWDLYNIDVVDLGAHTASCAASTAPEINVKQSTTSLTSGSGTYTFSPSVNVGSSSSAVTFTIENTGDAVLNLDGTPNKIAISGHTSDFTINQASTSATVAVTSGTTTFTVAFNPTAGGTRTAVISIDNNDSNEDPYTFTVTGTGVAITPTLGVSPSSIAFGTVTTNTTSSQNFFTLTSSNLTGNVTVTPPTGFEISTTSGGPYSASAITLTPAQAASVAVYVVFKPTAATGYSGNVAVSGGGATTVNVAVTGTGIAPCAAPANQATSLNLTPAATTVDGSFTAASGGASGYLVLASTSATPPTNPTNGSTYTTIGAAYNGNTIIAANMAGTTFTASSLTANTPYYFYIYAYNNTSCTGGPVYKTPALTGNTTTLNAPVSIATYTFTGAAGNEATWPADAPQPTGVNAGVMDRFGVVSAVSAANTFGTASWQTSGGNIDLTRYVEFTVAPTAGYELTLTNFSFQDQISGSGPVSFALRSSKDSYAANIFSGSTNGTITDPAHTTTLTGFTNLTSTTTFRIYGYGASAGGGTWRLDNVIVQGFINTAGPTLVVNPTTLTFGNVNINTTSAEQSFTVEGINLTNGVSITPPAGYEISLTSGSGYSTSTITRSVAQAAAGFTVYVVFKPTATTTYNTVIPVTSTGATTQNVTVTGTGTVPPPTITASTTGTLAFGSVNINTTSAEQSYTVSGANLTANLVVTAPTNFAVSKTSGGPYTSSVSFTPASGTVATSTIYVVYQPTANGASSGNVTNASTGATTRNVAVSGTGVTPCVAPANQATNLTFPSIAGTTINGSFTAAVGGADGYLVMRSTSSTLSTGPVDGTSYTAGGSLGGGTVVSTSNSTTFSTSGAPVTTYYFFIYAYNNTGCVGGPIYKKPYLAGNATTLTSLYTAFDNFDRGSNGNVAGIPSSGGATAWTEVEGAAARVAIFNNKLVINGGSPAGADAASFNMTGKYATTFNNAQSDLVWVFNMASTRSNPSGFISTSSTFGSAVILGGTDSDLTDAGNGYAVVLGGSGSPDYVKIVRYTGGLMNPTNNANLTDIVSYTANSADQEILNVKVEYSPTTKIWKLYVNEPGGTASYNTSGTQPSFAFPDPTAATYGTAASSAADNNALLNSALPYSGFLFNHGTASDEYATFDNFNIPTAQECTENTWTGATSNNWFTASNWSCGQVPISTVDVVIPNTSSTTNRYPVINAGAGTATTADLTIDAGASVTIVANVVAGFPVSTNDLEVYGNLSNSGNANWGTGTVTLRGTSNQTINGNNTFQYLTIDNASGVSLASGTQKVYGTLALVEGVLATNGRLTIGSNATYTGLIDEFTSGYTGDISGSITVERYTTNTADNFFYIGAPVGGATISGWGDDFSLTPINGATDGSQVIPTSSCSPSNLQAGSPYGGLFDYRENTVNTCNLEGWHVRTTGSIPAGKGFIGRVAAGTTIDLTGTFVTNQTVTSPALTRSINASGRPPGMNLVANPFAAPIDWQAVYAANVGSVSGTAHFYQTSGPLAGTYVAVNNTLGGQEIGTSQAFIVQALTNGATINFNDGMKRNGANAYLRTAPAYEQLLTLDVAGNGYADRAYVAFGAAFTTGFDVEFDGRKLMSKPEQPSLYVNDGLEQYSIFAQPSVAQVQLIPVDFTAGTNGNFSITANLDAFDPTAMVYLEDRLTGTMTNLRMSNTYSFTATTGDAAERFVLHFYPAMDVVAEDATCAGLDGDITLNQPGMTEWNLELLDANGNSVYAAANFNGNHTVSNLAAGVYTLNLEHVSGYTVTKTYLVTGPAPVEANFTAPVQATEGDDVTFTNMAVNATSYTWNFGDGNTSTDANPVHAYQYAGQYLVELVATNGACQESFTQLVTVQEKLANGIDNVLEGNVKIYAFETDINIVLSNLESVSTVDVFDLTGRKIINSEVLEQINGNFVISLEDVVNGYYFIRLNNQKDTFIQKVFVSSGK